MYFPFQKYNSLMGERKYEPLQGEELAEADRILDENFSATQRRKRQCPKYNSF